jgi:hypothetical protein
MEQEIINIIEIGLTLLAALIAWFRHRSANQSELTTNQVISYFDPADDTVTTAPDAVPGRSWKMTDSTKRWLTFDHTPVEQESLLRQVAEAETGRLDTYTISVPSAWYDIEYGLIKGSGKTDDHA